MKLRSLSTLLLLLCLASQPHAQRRNTALPNQGRFTIQVLSVSSQEEAEAMTQQLQAKGLDAYWLRGEVPDQGTRYRVRVGRYATNATAQAHAQKLRGQGTIKDYLVTKWEPPDVSRPTNNAPATGGAVVQQSLDEVARRNNDFNKGDKAYAEAKALREPRVTRIPAQIEKENPRIVAMNGQPDLTLSVLFSSDGRSLATISINSFAIWDMEKGKESSCLVWNGDLSFVKYSPDGKTIAIGSNYWRKLVKLWKVKSGQFILLGGYPTETERRWGVITLSGHTDVVKSVVFSPDSKTVATGSSDKTIKLWSVETGKELRALKGHAEQVNSVAFSPDGKILASGGSERRGDFNGDRCLIIKLWDVESGQLLKTFQGPSEEVKSVAFSPNGKLIISISQKEISYRKIIERVTLWDLKTEKELATFTDSYSATFSPDGKVVAISKRAEKKHLSKKDEYGSVKLWDVEAGKEVFTIANIFSNSSATFSPTGNIIATLWAGRDGAIKLWDAKNGKELRTLKAPYHGVRRSIAFSPDGRTIAACDQLQFTTLFDVESGKVVASLITNNDHRNPRWCVITPDQRFDTNEFENWGLFWVIGEDWIHPRSLHLFMRQYYEPNLLRKALDRVSLPALPSTSQLNHIQPNIGKPQISMPKADGTVDVTVEIKNTQGEIIRDNKKETLTSGVYDLRLFRDNQLVGQSTPQEFVEKYIKDAPRLAKEAGTANTFTNTSEDKAWREANDLTKVVKFENGKATYTFRNVKLPRDGRKKIEFSVYAFNDHRVKSETARLTYEISGKATLKPEPRKAFVITFGVNKYDNPEWDLQFAGNDARAMREVVSAKLREQKDFAEVVEIPLISDRETINNKIIEKRHATKSNVQAVFELLAGKLPTVERLKNLEQAVGLETLKKLRQVNPDDMILVSFSSHGYADQNGSFYLLPTDIGKNSGRRITNDLLSRSISSDELSLWLRDVDAGEMVMIVDACHSAASVEGQSFKPGPMGSRGLGQLAYDKKIRILAATQADNVALEMNRLQHGLLSAALLEDGLKSFLADHQPKDGKIELGEWLNYGVERVPQLYEDIRAGRRTLLENGRPVERLRGSELVGITSNAPGRRAASIQQPALFDFARNHREVILRREPSSR
jgi:WD40 repeat protein